MKAIAKAVQAISLEKRLFGLEALIMKLTDCTLEQAKMLMAEVGDSPLEMKHYMGEWPLDGCIFSVYLMNTADGISISVMSPMEFIPA